MEVKQLKRYDDELLSIIIHRDTAILLGEYNKLNAYSLINFTCKCGINAIKKFRYLCDKGGAFCKECAKVNGKHKAEETNLKKFGTKNPFGSKLIQEKIRKDMKEKHGVEYSSQRKDVSEKVKLTKNARTDAEKLAELKKRQDTTMKNLGVSNPSQSQEIQKKKLETLMKNYNVTNPTKSPEIRLKIKNTVIQKYGTDNVSKIPEVISKIKLAASLKTDEEKQKIQGKTIETNRLKYGTDYESQSLTKEETDKRNVKREETCMERFNCRNPAQDPDTLEKIHTSAKKYKDYVMPSGKIVRVQGYEPFALSDLLKIYQEENIKTSKKDIGRIPYENNGIKRYYFPDILITHENKLIEVKSRHTYNQDLEENTCKGKACKAEGYLYEIWIYNRKGICEETIVF